MSFLGQTTDRRKFCAGVAGALVTASMGYRIASAEDDAFHLNYMLASCMYGTTPLDEILPEVHKVGADSIDIWPLRHGNQREQMDEIGHDAFADQLAKYDLKLGMLTRYDLGPWKLAEELPVAKRFGAKIIICGSGGPKGLSGTELKAAVQQFIEKLKPEMEAAASHGVTIGIENHGNALIDSPDSIRYFAELAPEANVGIALAPYHLPQDPQLLAGLIGDLDRKLAHFYAWEHGMGCMTKLPKEQELLQMPGRGSLDFAPLLAALKQTNYQGWTEIFMHPVPRGIPILESTSAVTEEINRSRSYLDKLCKTV